MSGICQNCFTFYMTENEAPKTLTTIEDLRRNFEVGKLYADRGDYGLAIQKLEAVADDFYEHRDLETFLDCQNMLLRMYASREDLEKVQTLKEKIQDLVLKEGFELNSKTYYTLALCASYRGQNEAALEYLQKALALALAMDSKKDICYAINGIAICYKNLGKYAEALKEIYNLQVFFQVLELPEVRIASQILNAQIFNELKRHDQALELLWQTYDLLKDNKILHAHLGLLYNMGKTYMAMGDREMARTHLRLAYRSMDGENMKVLFKLVEATLEELGGDAKETYDLIFELENHAVVEKKLGRVDFKNQFILMDLLRLFVTNQGQVYSKEYLVEQVWKQSYDPGVHDNKIYVTIKRLRKMIEPDYDKPKYIFRAKNGYFMNKSAKVLIEQKGELQ
jgi:tetratricopeptide (TPR) repeat protein